MTLLSRISLPVSSLLLVAVVGCAPGDTVEPDLMTDEGLRVLASSSIGSFDNSSQSREDDGFTESRLHVARIWEDRDDGYWLYAERSLASTPDAPDARVYRLIAVGEEFYERRVFSVVEPARFAGAWRDPQRFEALAPDELRRRPGCETLLRRTGERTFEGATLGRLCKSGVPETSYETSIVSLSSDEVTIWKRGFDENRSHIWGSRKGPYVFRRIDN